MQWRRHVGWRPTDRSWRIAAMFMVGSSLFAVGSFPLYAQLVDGRAVGITFVIGSLFFTAAGYSTVVDVINDGREGANSTLHWSWSPRGLLWWAVVVQFVGTLLFNVNTIDAMVTTFTAEETNRLVWAPDFFGSIAFLVASHLAWVHLGGGRFWFSDIDDPDWWSSMLNYVGSVFFMASAIASFTLTTTGETLNIAIVNSGTFLGALCFLVGAYLLLPATSANARH